MDFFPLGQEEDNERNSLSVCRNGVKECLLQRFAIYKDEGILWGGYTGQWMLQRDCRLQVNIGYE